LFELTAPPLASELIGTAALCAVEANVYTPLNVSCFARMCL
jgi:hypothetical protein